MAEDRDRPRRRVDYNSPSAIEGMSIDMRLRAFREANQDKLRELDRRRYFRPKSEIRREKKKARVRKAVRSSG